MRSRNILSAVEWKNRNRTKRHVIREFDRYTESKFSLMDTVAAKGLDESQDVHTKKWRDFKKAHLISSKTMANLIDSAIKRFFNNFEGRNRTDKGYLPAAFVELMRAIVETKSEEALSTAVGICMLVCKDYKTLQGKEVKAGKFVPMDGLKKKQIREKTGLDWAAVVDFWNVEGMVNGSDLDNPFWDSFVKKLESFKFPRWIETPIWIWIVDDSRKE